MTLDEHCRGANAFDVGAIIVMVAMMDAAITYLLVVIILLFSVVVYLRRGMSYSVVLIKRRS